jgi:3-methyladenine DNA glycosylase AlkD
MSSKARVKAALREVADPERAAGAARFFKTGKGEYGAGDKFIGVTVPQMRSVAQQFETLPLGEVGKLLDDSCHECRATALLILVEQFRRAEMARRQAIIDLYFAKLERVNNWDLVDGSAPLLLGAFLEDKPRGVLDELAASDHLWRQRIAIVATQHFIKRGDFRDTLRIAEALLNHEHDLIHKAVGWMLREVGKRDKRQLVAFLASRYQQMPRTMLRYAIERFPEPERKRYLRGTI